MFIRRLYYDLQTESVIFYYMMRDTDFVPTVKQDFQNQFLLQNRNSDNTGVIEWNEEDTDIESNFETKTVKVKNGEVVFEEPPAVAEPQNPYGIPDELVEQIEVGYRERLAKEVAEYGYDA